MGFTAAVDCQQVLSSFEHKGKYGLKTTDNFVCCPQILINSRLFILDISAVVHHYADTQWGLQLLSQLMFLWILQLEVSP